MTPTKADAAYHQLERMIVRRELEPGSLVSEQTLMEMTGLGRTPVREALQRLARSRLVQIHPGRGVMVPAVSMEAQLRMLELRRVLEVMAVRLAAERADHAARERIRSLIDRLERESFTLDTYLDTVTETHGLIVEGAGNPYLADAIAPVQGLSRRFWYCHVRDEGAEITAGSAAHCEVLRAIHRGDAAAAETASLALNDYLLQFTYATVGLSPHRQHGR